MSCSAVRIALALYAPHSPRSLVMTSTPARRTGSRGTNSGWSSVVALDARAVSTWVIASAYGREAATRSWALAIRLVATSSCALVIFFVDFTERIRRRSVCSWAGMALLPLRPGLAPDRLAGLHAFLHLLGRGLVDPQLLALAPEDLLELVERRLELGRDVVVPLAACDRGERLLVRVSQVLEELALEPADVRQRDVIQLAGGTGPDRDGLLLNRVRRVVRLLEQLHQAAAPLQLRAGGLIQVGGEGGERLQLAELRQVEPEPAGDPAHGLDLRVAADPGHRDAHVDGRADARVEQVGLQEDLAVGDGDDVGRDVGRDVVGLGLDERQAGHRAAAQLVGELRAPLQQAGVQVEDVAGVGLTAGRAAQQQGHRTVGLGLLGQVVGDDRRVLQRAVLLQRALDRRDGGGLLTDRHVDATDLLLRVAGAPVVPLVDDRVDGDRGLAGLAVADDQLTLTPADRRHGVDRLDALLQRLLDALAGHHVRRLELQLPELLVLDVAQPVDRLAERVDHPAEERVPDRFRQHPAGALDPLALLDTGGVAEHHDADLAHIEVQRDTEGAVVELQQLVGHRRGQPLDVGDAVTRVGDDTDLLAGDLRRVRRDIALQGTKDLVGGDGQLGHPHFPFVSLAIGIGLSGEGGTRLDEATQDGAVVQIAADLDAQSADDFGVDRHLDGDVSTVPP